MRPTLRPYLPATLIALFVLTIAFYAYYQSRAIIEGPSITVETPVWGMTSTTSLITIKGFVKHAKEITLDGRPIFIDLSGRFDEKLALMEGYNIIGLTAKDVGGRVEKKTIELVYQKE